MALRTLSLPGFRNISDTDFQEYVRIFAKSGTCISDLTPNALQIWHNHDAGLRYTRLRDVAVIQYNNIFEPGVKTNVVGCDSHIVSTIHSILDHLEYSQGSIPRIDLVSESTAARLRKDTSLTIVEDTSSTNYLFNTGQQVNEATVKGSKRGASLRRFERKNTNITFSVHALPHAHISAELLQVYQHWKSIGSTTRSDPLDVETAALARSLCIASLASSTYAMVLRCGDEPVAFGIYQIIPRPGTRMAVLHHLKADYRVSDVSEYFFHCVMRHMSEISVEILNGEQDLGIEGMRTFKQRLGPCGYEKAYTISRERRLRPT